MTRPIPNKVTFKDTVVEYLDGLISQKYAHRYSERLVFIKKYRLRDTIMGIYVSLHWWGYHLMLYKTLHTTVEV
jgi:hypothetical protein